MGKGHLDLVPTFPPARPTSLPPVPGSTGSAPRKSLYPVHCQPQGTQYPGARTWTISRHQGTGPALLSPGRRDTVLPDWRGHNGQSSQAKWQVSIFNLQASKRRGARQVGTVTAIVTTGHATKVPGRGPAFFPAVCTETVLALLEGSAVGEGGSGGAMRAGKANDLTPSSAELTL